MIIAIINKTPIYRSGMAFFLREELPNETVIESESISALEKNKSVEGIDLIVMEANPNPEAHTVPNIMEAKNSYPSSKLILVGAKLDPSSIINYFSLGVSGYLDNDAALSELARCIENVSVGKKFISLDLLWALANDAKLKVGFERKKSILTRREYRIARCLLEGKRVTWIAKELSLKPSTVSTVKATIFKKLGVNDIIKLRDRMDDLDGIGGSNNAGHRLGA